MERILKDEVRLGLSNCLHSFLAKYSVCTAIERLFQVQDDVTCMQIEFFAWYKMLISKIAI